MPVGVVDGPAYPDIAPGQQLHYVEVKGEILAGDLAELSLFVMPVPLSDVTYLPAEFRGSTRLDEANDEKPA